MKIKKFQNLISYLLMLSAMLMFGCRGQESREPPIHLNPNMDNQEKVLPFAESKFYKDGRAMRPLPKGTVPRGHLEEDAAFYKGKVGSHYVHIPLTLTGEFLERGRERYEIYCAMCHGLAGNGDGIVIKRGFQQPPSYHQKRIRDLADGELFEIIGDGIRGMPGYKTQIGPADRWAIVAYMRALQRSQNATLADVPDSLRNKIN